MFGLALDALGKQVLSERLFGRAGPFQVGHTQRALSLEAVVFRPYLLSS